MWPISLKLKSHIILSVAEGMKIKLEFLHISDEDIQWYVILRLNINGSSYQVNSHWVSPADNQKLCHWKGLCMHGHSSLVGNNKNSKQNIWRSPNLHQDVATTAISVTWNTLQDKIHQVSYVYSVWLNAKIIIHSEWNRIGHIPRHLSFRKYNLIYWDRKYIVVAQGCWWVR